MSLPLLLSVPHAGLEVPTEAQPFCVLTYEEIVHDGDEGAAEIYDLESEVAAFVTTEIARAIVDLNRADDDRRKDGVVKTHTCWDVPVYRPALPETVVRELLERYYHPFHRRLSELGGNQDLRLAIDCHTMAAVGPPVGPDAGKERPWICLSNADGTCPEAWIDLLKKCLEEELDGAVKINDPFQGGYITRRHSIEMPWLQLEMSRADFLPNQGKRTVVLQALKRWINLVGNEDPHRTAR